IDLTKDAQDWKALPEPLREPVMEIFTAFFLGEAAVTDTLSPLVHAAPTDEDRQFLSTQLVDEARHTIFFERFFSEVIGMSFEEAKQNAVDLRLTATNEYGYGKVFYGDLVETTEAVREDPTDYGKFVDAIVMYHMLVEGMLALQGQRQVLQGARAFNIVPGFRAGFTAVTRDESRHVNYGVYALAEAVKAGLHDRIVRFTNTHIEAIADVGTRTDVEIPAANPGIIRSLLPDGIDIEALADQGKFAIMQLRKRLKGAGIRDDALDSLEEKWFARRDFNFDEYERKFGKEHPGRYMQAALRAGNGSS
ncbi:MAG: ribonucleotide-diphosphate reductase subunit beta, partial [Acidimicrobiia bacterium]